MANLAFYNMRIKGERDNVEEFIRAMKCEGEYKDYGVGRVYSFNEYEHGGTEDEYYIVADGDCAWSVLSAMRDPLNPNNIEKLSKRLCLDIECYSEECGFEFQEHYAVSNGEVLCDGCVDWLNIYKDDVPKLPEGFWYQKLVVQSRVTKNNYLEHIRDDYLEIGGYPSFEWMYA